MVTRPSRLFRLLLRLLPGDFRGDFGDAMTADVEGGRGAAFWWREFRSLLGAIVREHLDALRQDVKYTLRTMRRTPGFTAMAVLMLALGTGVNVAMFSIVDAVLLRSPFEHPGQLVRVGFVTPERTVYPMSHERYRDLAASPGSLSAVGAFTNGLHVLTGQGDPQNVDDIECVTPEIFNVLGTRPLLGRTFGPDDDHLGAAPTIVLSHDFWRQLGGSPAILGTPITINQTPVTVIGVMPRGFAGPLARADVQGWLPRNRPLKSADNAGCRQGDMTVIARIPRGLTLDAAASARPGMRLIPLESPIMEDVRTPFTVLMAAVVCVLLIAWFNVGGLQMERSLARRREMALRLALGASRGRLVRQTLTENVLLALVGAVAGIIATVLTLRTIVSMLPANVPYLDQIEVNVRVLAVTMSAATAVGLIAGLLPLAEMRRVAPARDLGDAMRASERRGSRGRRALVVLEIALSIVVLIGAALMVQTFLTLRPTHPGFDPERKLVMNVRLRGATPQIGEQFFGELFDRLHAAPAIRDAAGAPYFPMSGNIAISSIKLGDAMKDVFTNYPTPGFLSLLRIPVVAGRMLSAGDTRGSEPVMMVNQLLAMRIRPDGQVVGQRILVRPQTASATDAPVERTIVGVLADTRNSGVHTRASAEAFIPYAQVPLAFLTIVAEAQPGREAEAALQMRAAVRQIRPDLIVGPPQSMEVMIRRRMGATRFGAWLLAVIAALAVGLAGIGLMTTIGWWVRQRRRELGVRIALGATRGGVTRLVLRQGMTLAASGVVLGCAAAAGVTRYLTGWIYGVTPVDTATFAGCAALMLVIAVCAVLFPVRQATSVDPVVALRTE